MEMLAKNSKPCFISLMHEQQVGVVMRRVFLTLSFFLFFPLLASAEPPFTDSFHIVHRDIIINENDASVPFDVVYNGIFDGN